MECINEIQCPKCYNSHKPFLKFQHTIYENPPPHPYAINIDNEIIYSNNRFNTNICILCKDTKIIKCKNKIHSYPEYKYCDFCFLKLYNFVNSNLKNKIIEDYKQKS